MKQENVKDDQWQHLPVLKKKGRIDEIQRMTGNFVTDSTCSGSRGWTDYIFYMDMLNLKHHP